ncbi:MAG: glycosyltransferase [Flavobacteriia bacterium]|nr:glycosyltransferase [Flavobacteriia bacterium]
MKLSIIIVNYNVRYFLEQCLRSVEKAIDGLDAEVWVVDNDSSDDSMAMVADRFPWVKTIENKKNVGFATANNQAANDSKSDYVLLLNPDTILPEDNLKVALEYMTTHPKCGALGIKMHDGSGEYLPESKRGLPTPWVAFYKIFGLSSLFPKSKKFAKYHMGHLDAQSSHRVEILAGAYMLMKREAWEKAGGLDETYFMYGEDIDLSYSVEKAGYEVHYLADSPIIHYKGESTKKGSLNYVFMFYNAMLIFAKKHLSKGYARVFSLLIRFAIYLRAGLSVVKRIIKRTTLPLLDLALFVGGMQLLIGYWESNHRFIEGGSYPEFYKLGITPIYGLLYLLGITVIGGYRKPIQLNRIITGLLLGISIIFGAYALSPEEYRFSRALIVLGGVWMTFGVFFIRLVLSFFPTLGLGFWRSGQRRVGYIGSQEGASAIRSMAKEESKLNLFEKLNAGAIESQCELLDINELIFDAEQLSYKEIIECITHNSHKGIKFQIAYPSEGWMIGSSSIHTQGKATAQEVFELSKGDVRRSKRTFDVVVVVFLWILTPFAIWAPRFNLLWWNSFAVLAGLKTWIGYSGDGRDLPQIRKAVVPIKHLSDNSLAPKVDKTYAATSDVNLDARTLIRYLRFGVKR